MLKRANQRHASRLATLPFGNHYNFFVMFFSASGDNLSKVCTIINKAVIPTTYLTQFRSGMGLTKPYFSY